MDFVAPGGVRVPGEVTAVEVWAIYDAVFADIVAVGDTFLDCDAAFV